MNLNAECKQAQHTHPVFQWQVAHPWQWQENNTLAD